MADDTVNLGRRRFLTATTAVVGGVGTLAAAVPFLRSWQPSAQALVAGAPITVDISKLEVGQRQIAMWRGQPIWIIKRTPEVLAELPKLDDRLKDPKNDNADQQPDYAKNETRSIKPEVLVLVGVCTHLGCSPQFKPKEMSPDMGADWAGGFYCPCHGSKFDFAGRVYKGAPAPINLQVPRYTYLADTKILIGEDKKGA